MPYSINTSVCINPDTTRLQTLYFPHKNLYFILYQSGYNSLSLSSVFSTRELIRLTVLKQYTHSTDLYFEYSIDQEVCSEINEHSYICKTQ